VFSEAMLHRGNRLVAAMGIWRERPNTDSREPDPRWYGHVKGLRTSF
jgi:hypothetical protein